MTEIGQKIICDTWSPTKYGCSQHITSSTGLTTANSQAGRSGFKSTHRHAYHLFHRWLVLIFPFSWLFACTTHSHAHTHTHAHYHRHHKPPKHHHTVEVAMRTHMCLCTPVDGQVGLQKPSPVQVAEGQDHRSCALVGTGCSNLFAHVQRINPNQNLRLPSSTCSCTCTVCVCMHVQFSSCTRSTHSTTASM